MFLTNFFSEKKSFSIPNKRKIRKLIKQLCLSEKKKLKLIEFNFLLRRIPFKNKQKAPEELLLVRTIEDGLKGVKFISSVVESGSSGGKWIKF